MQTILSDITVSDEEKEEECVFFLKERGYIVVKPKESKIKVSKISDLVELFYSLLLFYNPNRRMFYTSSGKEDKKHAKLFLESRISTGINRKQALRECAEIIECVLKYESLFNFSEPVSSMNIFGREKMKWVSDRAVSIINGENKQVEEIERNLYFRDLFIKQEKDVLDKLDIRSEFLKNFLEGLDKDG